MRLQNLGYAVTAHRAQGVTVDTAHTIVNGSTTRENLYVVMTRGRDSNTAYVALDQPDEIHTTPQPDEVTARTILYGVLQHTSSELSAHQTIEAEHETWSSIAQLAAELETLAAGAQHDRFTDLLRRAGLTPEQHTAVVACSAFGPFTAALRRAEAYHHDLEQLVPRIVSQHRLDDAEDIAAVLRHRLDNVTAAILRDRRSLPPRLIAGLIPEPQGPMSDEYRQAIAERKNLIEHRARALAEHAIGSNAIWARRLGQPPPSVGARERWLAAASTVAAYRDRYHVTSHQPVGGAAESDAQRADRQCALRAMRKATALAEQARGEPALHRQHRDRAIQRLDLGLRAP